MNSKSIQNKFDQILDFNTTNEKIEHDSKIIMFKFLSIVEKEMALRNMSKKELAKQLGTSPSYITQLFRGTKNINLLKLAQLQHLFGIEFNIKAQKSELPKKHKTKLVNAL